MAQGECEDGEGGMSGVRLEEMMSEDVLNIGRSTQRSLG
jgi:hypothetical protein